MRRVSYRRDSSAPPQTCVVRVFGSEVAVGDRACSTTNEIFTSKYRWYNFLPKNLWEQYHNLSVVYFSVTMFLQLMPQLTITRGKPTMLAPLTFVLLVGAVKDLSEDLKRKKADREENERNCTRLFDWAGERQEAVQWSSVQAGQVLKIFKGELIPADLLLLDSSDEAKKCYVETMNLDGETNLKQKAVELPEDWTFQTPGKGLVLDFEEPTADLYVFKGALMLDGQEHESLPQERKLYGVGINSLLLRGSSLQQTDWVVGMAVYCGPDTRVMRNSRESRFKQSELDLGMNRMMLLVFTVQLFLCVGASLCNLWYESGPDWWSSWYLKLETKEQQPIFLRQLYNAGRWFLLMNNMIPIAMPIGLTTIKLFQGWFIQWDTECEDKMRRRPAEVHTSQVLESLGQVTHVFSDKTGTLTCNEMVYKACSVAGKLYGHVADEGTTPTARASSRQDEHVDFADVKRFNSDLGGADVAQSELMARFLLCHAACHTVTIEAANAGAKLKYAASSPDELALVSAAREIGLALIESGQNRVVLEVANAGLERALQEPLQRAASGVSTLSVDLLDLCEFDNDRKRMSVVAKLPSGRLLLLLKGADTSVLPLIDNEASVSCVRGHLHRLACGGLRTLCLGGRELSAQDHERWHARYEAALAAVSEDRAERLQMLAKELETAPGLQLLGATAIEDRLQDDVPVTIEKLRNSGICVWVLTGDKLETAINIGKMCRLLTDSMVYMELASAGADLADVLADLRANTTSHSSGRDSHQALTVTGQVLGLILPNPKLALDFFRLVNCCESVICCRVSPKQKADVVDLVKQFHRAETQELPVTLAIGDGANDVAMITAAHVGVGLSGKEGAQAARAADFAISQFRYLERLLLVHGRESYRRNSVFVCYNFYKNAVLCLPALFAGFLNRFSGQNFYEELMYQCYNIVYTFLPVMVYAMTDRGVQDMSTLQANPLSYLPGRQKAYFNRWIFCCWMCAGCLQAMILCLGASLLLGECSMVEGVVRGDMNSMGATIYLWIVLCVNITLVRRLSLITLPTIAAAIACVFPHLPLAAALDLVLWRPQLHGVFRLMYGSFRTLLISLLILSSAYLLGECVLALATPAEPSPSKEDNLSVIHALSDPPSLPRTSVGVSVKLVSQVSSWAYDEECSATRKASIARARTSVLEDFEARRASQMSRRTKSLQLPEPEVQVELPSFSPAGSEPRQQAQQLFSW